MTQSNLTREDVRNILVAVFREVLNDTTAQLHDGTTMQSLGLDSVDRRDIVLQIEDALNIRTAPREAKTFGDFLNTACEALKIATTSQTCSGSEDGKTFAQKFGQRGDFGIY